MHGSYYGGGTPRTARQAPYSNGYIGSGSPRQQNIPAANGGPGVLFRSRQERVDWRRLASIDVDHIRREYDTTVLQEFVNNVTYCDIEQETDMRTVDPNFVKLFKLAQLIIEYLIHSQSYLSNSVEVVQEQLNQANEAHIATKQELTKVNEDLHKAKQESRKRRNQITAQQSIMGLGPNGYHKCPYCEKAFIHATYLQSHLQRKHAEFMTQTEDVEARKENERLEKEIEQMKDKLNLMESQFEDERKSFRQQIETQKMEQSKMDRSVRQEEDQRQQMERWKQQQLDMQKSEMEKMQGMFMKELKEMNEKYSSSQTALEDLQSKYGKQSMLGRMQDEDELAEYKEALKKQQKEQEKLKKQLAKEITSMKSTMEDELKASERRWKERTRQQKEAHKDEIEQLRERLDQAKSSLRIEREGGDQVGQKYEQQMKDLRKKNKETERALKERERVVKERENQITDLRAQLKSKPKTPVPIAATPSPKPMSPSEEEETETEEEEEESESEERPLLDTQQRKRLVDGMRESLQHILSDSLARKGVPEGAKGISSQSLENKLKALKLERQNLARRHPKFYDIRKNMRGELENRAKKRSKKTSGSSRTRPSSSVSPLPSSSQQHRPSTSKHYNESEPRYSSTPTSRPKSTSSTKSSALRTSLKTPPPVAPRGSEPIYDIPPNNRLARPTSKARVSFDEHQFAEDSDEDDDDEEEEETDDDLSDDSEDEEGQIRTKSQTSQGQQRIQQGQRSQGQRPQSAPTSKLRGRTEGTIEEESEEDSEWDSEDISELQEVSPSKVTRGSKVAAGQKPTSQRTPQRSHHRPKKDGPKVAELSRSIERQLSGRHKDKKPAGGVDLGSTNDSNQLRPDSREDTRSPSPSIPTIPDADDWDDDSDSLAVSSLEGSLSAAKPVPTPRQSKPPLSENGRKHTGDTDMSNTYGTSVWGSSSNKDSKSGGTGKTSGSAKSSLVSVTDLDDDDDDFDISDEL